MPFDRIDASIDELVAGIRYNVHCALPWLAVKRAATMPGGLERLAKAYGEVRTPANGDHVDEMALMLRAAAGDAAAAVAWYDGNVRLHPSDKSLPNAACFIRGELAADLAHADAYCDAAMAYHRPAYALVNRGVVELLTGRFAAAMADYDEALAAKNFANHFMRPEALYGRGVARVRLGDPAGHADIDEAVAIRPDIVAVFADKGLTP